MHEGDQQARIELHDHEFWGVRSSVLAKAATVLGDEFSVTGVAITLGLPRPDVAQALSHMAAVGWIGRIASCKSRGPEHGPWYEPRPKWTWLAARRFSLFAREMETDLALSEALQVARSRNRNWHDSDCLVTELWAWPAPAGGRPRRSGPLELALACCARPGRPVRPMHGLDPHSPAWEQTRAAFKVGKSSLIAHDLPAIAPGASVQPLYRVSADFELWFTALATVQEFPTAFLACVQEWRSHPEQFQDLRKFATDGDVDRLRGMAVETAANEVGSR